MMIYLSIIKFLISRCNRIGRRRRHRIDYRGTWHLEARNTRQRSWYVFLGEISVFLYSLQRRSELRIRLEEPFDKILPVSARYRIVNLPIMIVTYPRVRFFQRCCVERWLPYQQGVQYAPERPNIRLVTICLLIQHFRRDVIRCSAYRPAHTNELLQFSRVSSAQLFLILEINREQFFFFFIKDVFQQVIFVVCVFRSIRIIGRIKAIFNFNFNLDLHVCPVKLLQILNNFKYYYI